MWSALKPVKTCDFIGFPLTSKTFHCHTMVNINAIYSHYAGEKRSEKTPICQQSTPWKYSLKCLNFKEHIISRFSWTDYFLTRACFLNLTLHCDCYFTFGKYRGKKVQSVEGKKQELNVELTRGMGTFVNSPFCFSETLTKNVYQWN